MASVSGYLALHLETSRFQFECHVLLVHDGEIGTFLESADQEDAWQWGRALATKTIESGAKGRSWEPKKRGSPVPELSLWRLLVERGSRWDETIALRMCGRILALPTMGPPGLEPGTWRL